MKIFGSSSLFFRRDRLLAGLLGILVFCLRNACAEDQRGSPLYPGNRAERNLYRAVPDGLLRCY